MKHKIIISCLGTQLCSRSEERRVARVDLRATSSLLLFPELMASSLTLGDLLSLEEDNHRRQRLYRLREVSECLRIEQDMGL